MTPPALTRARWVRRLSASAAALAVLLATPAPAWAHGHLTASQPAAGARLTTAPRVLTLTFSEVPELAVSSLRLVFAGADSTPVALGTLAHAADRHAITAAIDGPLAAGDYVVYWQVAGADGHVVRGSYAFSIAEGAAGLRPLAAAAAPASTPPPATAADSLAANRLKDFDSSSPVYVVIRWAQFVGLLLLIGAVAFRWWMLPRVGAQISEPARLELAAGTAGTGLAGAWLLGLTALLRLVAQSLSTHGAIGMVDGSAIVSMVSGTTWGHAWLFELVWLAVVILNLRHAARHPASLASWGLATLAAVALAFVPAMSGHAAVVPGFGVLSVISDALHVLSAGCWIGGLAVILVTGIPVTVREAGEGRAGALAAMVNAFSPLALVCAATLVVTGFIAARFHLGSVAALWQSSYGQTLLVKLAVIVVLIPVATWNWRRVRPSLSTHADGAERLTTSGRIELSIAMVILLVTAVLVALPTPMDL